MMEVIKYKGFSIDVSVTNSPMNPFTDWDCLPPTVAQYWECGRAYMTAYGDIDSGAPMLSDETIRRHAADIAVLGNCGSLLRFVRQYCCLSDYPFGYDAVNDAIANFIESEQPSDAIETIAEIWRMVPGCTALCASTRGYSQGDYAEVLVVSTPDWRKKMGIKEQCTEDSLQSTVDLYGHWAWGDVYGYSVQDKSGNDIDSCYGFYGDNHEKSGLADTARSGIDAHIHQLKVAHFSQLKKWIKHGVPFLNRAGLCHAIS